MATASESHGVLIGIVIMLVFAVVATEVGGTSKQNAELIILVLLGLLVVLGMEHAANFASWAAVNPFNPTPFNTTLPTVPFSTPYPTDSGGGRPPLAV